MWEKKKASIYSHYEKRALKNTYGKEKRRKFDREQATH